MAAIEISNRIVNVEQWHAEQSKKLVLLHGFTGTAKSWEPFAQLCTGVHIIAIDITGHGNSDVPTDATLYEMNVQIQLIDAVLEQLEISSFTLLGYSMGGRIALSYAAKYSQKVEKLILESASPGLVDENSRQERMTADNELANFIEQQGIDRFVERWENIPLFATQKQLPKSVQQQIREERLSQHPTGLANSLRGIGTGKMPAMWDRLNDLTMPVHLLVGELDTKFVNIANEMEKRLGNAHITEFLGCGHTIHVENLPQFATIVKESIS